MGLLNINVVRSFGDLPDESVCVLIGSNGTDYKNKKKILIYSLFFDVLRIIISKT